MSNPQNYDNLLTPPPENKNPGTSPGLSLNLRREQSPQELDENGEYIFRFQLDLSDSSNKLTLSEYYQYMIWDLLQLVRFYSNGSPIIIDGFAFNNEPDQQISITPPQLASSGADGGQV